MEFKLLLFYVSYNTRNFPTHVRCRLLDVCVNRQKSRLICTAHVPKLQSFNMTKTKLRKNNSCAKQFKKTKTVAANVLEVNAVVEGLKNDKKKQEISMQENEKLSEDRDKDTLQTIPNWQVNETQKRLKEKLRKVFVKKDEVVLTGLGRLLLLILVTILTFGTRYYKLREPKHIW